MILPATPGGGLIKRVRNEFGDFVGPDRGQTKYMERAAKPVTAGLMRSDPFPKQGCDYGEPRCIAGPGCSRTSQCYEIL